MHVGCIEEVRKGEKLQRRTMLFVCFVINHGCQRPVNFLQVTILFFCGLFPTFSTVKRRILTRTSQRLVVVLVGLPGKCMQNTSTEEQRRNKECSCVVSSIVSYASLSFHIIFIRVLFPA